MSTRRALALAIFVLGVGAAPPAAAEWRRIDSPNFVVIGDVSARTWRSVAIEFEGFRETLTRVMTERATSTPVPTIGIVFPSDRAFTPFKPLYQGKPVPSAGLFVGRQDANYIAVVTEGDVDRMRIVFHELQAGEQRLEGVLAQIECGVEDSALFHVRTAAGGVRVPGRMKTIDFVAFRDDLSSHIGCGPLKPALPVYLTWRADPASASEKLVVAVEFLPKIVPRMTIGEW